MNPPEGEVRNHLTRLLVTLRVPRRIYSAAHIPPRQGGCDACAGVLWCSVLRLGEVRF